MRSSVVWKNMAVAIIKSKKVYSVSYNFGESVCIFSFHLELKEDNFLMLLTTFRLPAQLCCWNSLLMQDFWSSPPVVALACLHILPISASCRTGVFCCFEFSLKPNSLVFFWTGVSGKPKLSMFFLCLRGRCSWPSLGFIMIGHTPLLGRRHLGELGFTPLLPSSPLQCSTALLYTQWMQPFRCQTPSPSCANASIFKCPR